MTYRTLGLVMLFVLYFNGQAPAAQLVHLYSFSANGSDAVGSADGVLVGGAQVAGGELLLDGSTAYVQFGTKIVPTSGSYSVAYFARADSLPNRYFEHISQGFSNGPGFYIGQDPAHRIRLTDRWPATGVQYPADSQRHHFAFVSDAGTATTQFYIDGVVVYSTNEATTTTNEGTNTRLGKQFDCCAEYFPGALDELRIYVGALSPQEIAILACRADFDRDGFITGLDYDLYVQAFEAGGPAADFDGDGFITGVDFDLYVQAFEAGC